MPGGASCHLMELIDPSLLIACPTVQSQALTKRPRRQERNAASHRCTCNIRADERDRGVVFKPLGVVSDTKYARIIDMFWKLRYMIGAGSTLQSRATSPGRPPFCQD